MCILSQKVCTYRLEVDTLSLVSQKTCIPSMIQLRVQNMSLGFTDTNLQAVLSEFWPNYNNSN